MNATDVEALHALYVENRQELYTYALSITRNREAAEDSIHSVVERLLRSGKLPSELRPYVFRAVRNAAYDASRRAKVRTDSMFEFGPYFATDAASPDIRRGDDLEPLLQRLSPDEREAIVLKTLGGLTFQEIAQLRSVPLPTVASWHRRGLERLKAILAPER